MEEGFKERQKNFYFGQVFPVWKGKIVKSKSRLPRDNEPVDFPPFIIKWYKNVILSINIMNFIDIPLLVSKTYHIGYY